MFKKLLDEKLKIVAKNGKDAAENSFVLSLANDFEDAKWRHTEFHNFIWNNIAKTALSERERASLVGSPQTLLEQAAKNLRLTDNTDSIGAGSELAEAFLYGIMSEYFNALPVVPKIFYKQNTKDNAKGADSVHITIVGDDDFRIWFGEAKFYNTIEDARLGTIIQSVGESLRTDKLKKENAIICNVSDLDGLVLDDDLRDAIKASLSTTVSIDSLKPKLCIPILLLHECNITAHASSWDQSYVDSLTQFHRERSTRYLTKQLQSLESVVHMYDSIAFHVILFPVPEKKEIIKRFLSTAKFYKES